MRERSVFIDTSAFYALLDARDRWTSEARQQFAAITDDRRPLVTSNLVVAETYALARRALGHGVALRWLDGLDINLVFQTEGDHGEVCKLLARYHDKEFSYTDALSFVLMERLGVPTAFTFDAHFRQYGVEVLP
ncbi:MAG: hypothetical protein A2148_04885 [Chloroflexi bacterium RBG_16_68_14]|nr:MAG: hypothetical protein A2148_04885 [Chloroflexi bacterium RBG_16_68_14]